MKVICWDCKSIFDIYPEIPLQCSCGSYEITDAPDPVKAQMLEALKKARRLATASGRPDLADDWEQVIEAAEKEEA